MECSKYLFLIPYVVFVSTTHRSSRCNVANYLDINNNTFSLYDHGTMLKNNHGKSSIGHI